MNNKIHVAFYLRSATGNLADLNRQQKTVNKEFIRRGFSADECSIETYIDHHQTGMTFGPEFLRLIADVKDGKVHVVMASRLNRVSRSAKGLEKFFDLIRALKFRFITENENIDSLNWPWVNGEVANESH